MVLCSDHCFMFSLVFFFNVSAMCLEIKKSPILVY
ncbi:rCG20954, partial [Rattus norvegicus]